MAKKNELKQIRSVPEKSNCFFDTAKEYVHSLGEKTRRLALIIVPSLALTLSSCGDKTTYEKASDEYISAQEQLDKAEKKKAKALQEYNDAVREYEDAVRDCESAKQRVKQEAEKL